MWSADNILNQLSSIPPDKERYIECSRHGTMSLGMYAPHKKDLQKPHDQDELYFVLSGSGIFVHGNQKDRFSAGDTLFAAAGVNHHFEDFTDDFSAWVIFWGKTGGEGNEIEITP